MRNLSISTAAATLMVAVALIGPVSAASWVEVPFLVDKVKEGKLPPIAERVPANPRVVDLPALGRENGEYGGKMRMLMGKQKDIKMMTVYGYARLVGFNENFELVPDILESYDVQEGRIFTFRLRSGHKWSDGRPFTTEDFRYYWEDMASNRDYAKKGPDRRLLVDGKPPKVEILSETEIRYSWDAPNPEFLTSLAAASPLFIFKPAHYMKQFHAKYQDKAKLDEMIAEKKVRNWTSLHKRMGRQYRQENPDLPMLQPWVNTTKPPSDQFEYERNPFFHRTDSNGRQLPYIDEVVLLMGSTALISAKAGSGEAELQARYVSFDKFTFLKGAEERNNFKVRLWRTARGSQVALFPNLNSEDEQWRTLMRDVRFRRALSLAINREEINEVIYFGLARPSGDTVLPDSPLYEESFETAWTEYDPDRAIELLEEMGLTETDDDDVRLMPNGEPLEIIVTTAGESTEETDVLELIGDYWRDVGVKLFTQSSQREVFRNRVFAGTSHMSVWSGLSNAVPTAGMSPWELAPTTQQQLQWPMWGQHYETSGAAGKEADGEAAMELLNLFKAWQHSQSHDEKTEIWRKMLSIYSDQVFSIGTVNGARQPVVISNRLHNVPEEGVYNWDPGAYFGIYLMDSFWLSAN